MKKDKNPERPFREAPLAEIRDELIRNGMGEYADVASAVISGDFASAEKLMAEGVRNGTISIEDDVYALFNGMICQSLGMEALENDDDEKGADYLQSARSFFIMAKERGLDIPPVSSAIHMLNMFFGLDEDDDEDYDGGGMFDTDAIDYLGFKKVFPKGDEFKAVLRMPTEDFSIDELKDAYEEEWGFKPKSKKGKQNTWTLSVEGISLKVEYAKCIETISPESLRYVTGNVDDGTVEKLTNPSVARVTITALVGEDETSYERSIVFTKTVGALLASHDGVSITTGSKIRTPEEALEAIEAYPDDEWLAFIFNVGFAIEGNAAMSNLAIVSEGMAPFGFPEICVRKVGPDDLESASLFMLNMIKYIFQFGQGEPSDGTYYDEDGLRYVLKKRKKAGNHYIEVTVRH